MTRKALFLLVCMLGFAIAIAVSGCGGAAADGSRGDATTLGAENIQLGPTSIPRGTHTFTTDALVYAGTDTWAIEVESIQNILTSHGATYRTADAAQLNAMTAAQLAAYGTIVWPGGHAGGQAGALTTATKKRLRTAVREAGVSWVGFCAGAFIAVEPTARADQNPVYGLSIVDAPTMPYYYLEGVASASGATDIYMTKESFADGSTHDLVWYGGPITLSGSNVVVARYPNGDAAISQLWSGNGLVILSGPHPSAPQLVRDSFGLSDSDGVDFELSWKILQAAIHQQDLETFK